MAIERITAFLEELKTNPKAAELLAGREQPKNEEEKIKAYLEVAKELGFDLSAEDFAAFLKEQFAARKAKTDAQIDAVKALADDEVESVAGGQQPAENGDICVNTHGSCDYSYLNRENCWAQDGCDWVLRHYDDYECKRNEHWFQCNDKHMLDCNQFF